MREGIQADLFDVFEQGRRHPRASRIVGWAISVLVLANVGAAIIETFPELEPYQAGFEKFETISVYIFLAEYVFRIWSITASRHFAGTIRGRVRYAFTPLAMIDLMAILPSLLGWGGVADFRALRLLRLARILRILKLARYSESVRILGHVLNKTKGELGVCLFVAMLVMVIAATAMFQAEHAAQPEAFSSVPAAMWWAIVTLTTVGYGDVAPVTSLGRVVGASVALLGIGLFALPAGILGGAFVEELRVRRAGGAGKACPHCGQLVEGSKAHAPASGVD